MAVALRPHSIQWLRFYSPKSAVLHLFASGEACGWPARDSKVSASQLPARPSTSLNKLSYLGILFVSGV